MFTGIIEEIGKIQGIRNSVHSSVLTIGAVDILQDIHLGDSIAVSGVCLTVTSFSQSSFTADVMHETLNRSTLGFLHPGSQVNLERAMPANGRFGGHFVSGHIDGTGTICSVEQDGNAVWYTIKTSEKVLQYLIEKGSVAIDGISLTVARVEQNRFAVSVIPHTAQKTILSGKRAGDLVNLENDCIGKYVAKLVNPSEPKSRITADFLIQHGY